MHCGLSQPYFQRNENRIEIDTSSRELKRGLAASARPWKNLRPETVLNKVLRISNDDLLAIGICPSLSHPSFAILSRVMVPPAKVFPPMHLSNGNVVSDSISKNF